MSITKNEMEKTAIENLQFAKDCYEKENGFNFMAVVQTEKGGKSETAAIFAMGDGFIEHRFEAIFDMGVRFGIQKMKKEVDSIDAIYVMSEAWISDKTDMKPSEDPDRKECIISVGLSEKGDFVNEMYEIKKKWVNDKVVVEFSDITKNKKFEKMKNKKEVTGSNPLLERFWDGVALLKLFQETLPKDFEKDVKRLTTDEIFSSFISALSKLKKSQK